MALPAPSASVDAAYRFFSNSTLVRAHASDLRAEILRDRVEKAFLEMCCALDPTIAAEVGAHEATFSRLMKQQVRGARCIAFEANPYVHERYEAELYAAGVEYVHTAVSETKGDVDLTIPRRVMDQNRAQHGTSASLGTHRGLQRSDHVTVPSAPLDDLLQVSGTDVVVAWIDVEGANGTVLQSGRSALSRASLVFIEVESEHVWNGQWVDTDVARYFAELGLVPVIRDIQREVRQFQHNVVYADPGLAASPRMASAADELFRPEQPEEASIPVDPQGRPGALL